MSTPLFRTITDADWSRELRVSRATPNQIRARIASRLPRQITAQSESHNGSQPAMARRFDAFLSSPVQNRCNSLVESDARETSGECTGEDHLSKYAARIERGERLTNTERLHRQGLLFNHGGTCGAIVTTRRRVPLNVESAFLFTTDGSADREGGGTSRAEAGGGETLSGATPDTKANESASVACEN